MNRRVGNVMKKSTAERVLVVMPKILERRRFVTDMEFCNVLFADNKIAIGNAINSCSAVVIDYDFADIDPEYVIDLCTSKNKPYFVITEQMGVKHPKIKRPILQDCIPNATSKYLKLSPNGRILILNRDQRVVETFKKVSNLRGYSVVLANDCTEAQKALKKYDFKIALMDKTLVEGPGVNLISCIKRNTNKTQILLTEKSYADDQVEDYLSHEKRVEHQAKMRQQDQEERIKLDLKKRKEERKLFLIEGESKDE